MDNKKTVQKIINSAGGIAKTSDFVAAGLSNFNVTKLCDDGYIERIRHGYYQLAEKEDMKEEQVLATLLPESIVCVESALYYYGYSLLCMTANAPSAIASNTARSLTMSYSTKR